FPCKELRCRLAIAITVNFINYHTPAEAQVEEISGVARIFNQSFFSRLATETGIDLENIVYYKDETHYFVMTAKKHSLLAKGVLKQVAATVETEEQVVGIIRGKLEIYNSIESAEHRSSTHTTCMQLDDSDLALPSHMHEQMQVKTASVSAASASVDFNIHKEKHQSVSYNVGPGACMHRSKLPYLISTTRRTPNS
ncbi:unnamed protein product, partial [Schistosoma curassoni]|uniref:Guanylate cyclase domain-containing protein n=1 Tax=Schistosoma curassoni TaxID=6186 RepID=A0A183JM41_9TREM